MAGTLKGVFDSLWRVVGNAERAHFLVMIANGKVKKDVLDLLSRIDVNSLTSSKDEFERLSGQLVRKLSAREDIHEEHIEALKAVLAESYEERVAPALSRRIEAAGAAIASRAIETTSRAADVSTLIMQILIVLFVIGLTGVLTSMFQLSSWLWTLPAIISALMFLPRLRGLSHRAEM